MKIARFPPLPPSTSPGAGIQSAVQVFQEKKENKKEEVVGRIKELCGEEIPSGMFGRLVREIAIPSSNRQNWTAKAGLMGKTTADGT